MHIFASCGVKPGDPVSPRIGLIPLHRAEAHFQIVQRYILSIDFQVEHSTRRNIVRPACHPAVLVIHIFQREIYCAVKRLIFKLFVDQFNLQSIHRIDIAQCDQCTQAQPFVIFCCTDRIIVGKSFQISFPIVRVLLQFFIDLLDGCRKAGNIAQWIGYRMGNVHRRTHRSVFHALRQIAQGRCRRIGRTGSRSRCHRRLK